MYTIYSEPATAKALIDSKRLQMLGILLRKHLMARGS